MLTTCDIHPLYLRALAGDADALATMADEMGERAGFHWGDERGWDGDGFPGMWDYFGRLAPLVSVDCALSVPMPKGYVREWNELWGYIRVRLFGSNQSVKFSYTTPEQLPIALSAATLFAWAHHREQGR